MKTCGMSAIKYLLFFFNAIFAILGILIVAAASTDISYVRTYSASDDNVSGIETDILLIVIGLLILIIAAFGCFGAIKESTTLLYIYAGFLIVIIIFELSVAIASAALRPQMETTVKKQLRESFIKNKADTGHKVFWDNVQKNLECCGAIGPEDYNDIINKIPVPPASCCPMSESTSNNSTQTNPQRNDCVVQKKYYKMGCEDKILESLHGAGLAVIITGIVFCFLEVIGIALAIWLAHSIKNERKTDSERAAG